jgi:hypothetical protein
MAEKVVKLSQLEADARAFLERASNNGTSHPKEFELLVKREVALTTQQLKAIGTRIVE